VAVDTAKLASSGPRGWRRRLKRRAGALPAAYRDPMAMTFNNECVRSGWSAVLYSRLFAYFALPVEYATWPAR